MSTVYDEKLLDKVKLAMIPSGYTNNVADENNAGGALGKVYSVLPEQTLSDNLVTNGTFDTDTDWSKGTGWDITGGKAYFDNSTGTEFYQSLSTNAGKYIISFDLEITNGTIQTSFSSPSTSTIEIFTTSGTKSFEMTTTSSFSRFRFVGLGNSIFNIDNVSVKKVINGDFDFSRGSNATRVNSQGIVQNVEIISSELIQNGGFDTTLGNELIQNGDFEQISSELAQNRDFEQLGSNEISVGEFNSQSDVDRFSIASNRATKSLEDGFMRLTYTTTIGAALTINNAVTRFTNHKVTFRAKGTANANFTSIGENNSILNNPEYAVSNPTLTTDWQNYEFYVAVGSTSSFRFYLNTAQIGDTFDIDDIVIQEVGQNWEFYNGAYISEGKGYIVGDGSSFTHINQTNIFTIGKIYKVTLDAVINSGLGLKVQDGITNENFGFITTSGTYTFYGVANSTTLTIGRRTGGTAFDSYIDNISVKEVGQNWTLGDGAVVSDGSLSYDGTQSGNSNTNQTISSLDLNKIYKVSFTVSNYVSGNVRVKISNDAQGVDRSANGEYTEYLSGMVNRTFSVTGNGNFVGSVDNISVKEVQGLDDWNIGGDAIYQGDGVRIVSDGPAGSFAQQNNVLETGKLYKLNFDVTEANVVGNLRIGFTYALEMDNIDVGSYEVYFTSQGTHFEIVRNGAVDVVVDNISVVEVTRDTDIPRLDYTNSACPSLLLEPQRTNNILDSQDITDASLVNSSLEGGYLAPDGTKTAVKFSCDLALKGNAYVTIGANNSTLPTDARSIYARTVSGTGTTSLCSYHDNTNNIFTITEKWQRFDVLGTTTTTGESNFYAVDFRLNSTTLTEVILWAPQSEVGSYATSYIPTNGTTITRLADVCNNAGDSTIFNDNEGVLFADIKAIADDGTSRTISINNTSSNRVFLQLRATAGQVNSGVVVGGALQGSTMSHGVSQTSNIKLAIKYKQNDFSLFVNGSKVGTSSGNVFSIGTLNTLSFDNGSGSEDFYGKTRSLLYFDKALSDAELEYITSADIDLTVHNYKGSLNKISATYEDVGVKDRLTKLF